MEVDDDTDDDEDSDSDWTIDFRFKNTILMVLLLARKKSK